MHQADCSTRTLDEPANHVTRHTSHHKHAHRACPRANTHLHLFIAAASCTAIDLILSTSSCPKYPNSLPSPFPSTITHPSTSPVPGSATGTHIAAQGLCIPAKNHKPPKRASEGASARLQGVAVDITCDGMCSSGLKGVASRPARYLKGIMG